LILKWLKEPFRGAFIRALVFCFLLFLSPECHFESVAVPAVSCWWVGWRQEHNAKTCVAAQEDEAGSRSLNSQNTQNNQSALVYRLESDLIAIALNAPELLASIVDQKGHMASDSQGFLTCQREHACYALLVAISSAHNNILRHFEIEQQVCIGSEERVTQRMMRCSTTPWREKVGPVPLIVRRQGCYQHHVP
jgi:hypothetical protein